MRLPMRSSGIQEGNEICPVGVCVKSVSIKSETALTIEINLHCQSSLGWFILFAEQARLWVDFEFFVRWITLELGDRRALGIHAVQQAYIAGSRLAVQVLIQGQPSCSLTVGPDSLATSRRALNLDAEVI